MAYLGFYLFIGLALLGRLNFVRNRRDWSARRVYLNPEAPTDLSLSILVSAALVVILAWNVPVTVNEYKGAAQFWSDAAKPLKGIREKLRDAFAPVRQPVPTSRRDYYDQSLDLGIGSLHSDAVLFTVKVPPEALRMPRLYWRGIAYDKYVNGQWESTAPGNAKFQPQDEYLPLPDYVSTLAARYVFNTFMGGQRLLYTPANPVWVSRSASADFFQADVGSMDVERIRADRLLASGENYQARSPVSNPTVAQLRQAGEGYPEWVTLNYLQLPEGFSPLIAQLAASVTRDSQTPYDKAAAITDYLRTEMNYSERISSPPAGSDPIEWFLFQSKEGFCNYYASAEVLMLRSLGIPARLVAGFSQGVKSETGNIYTVRDNNAHAWPEVYFPDVGWVEFEPTANQDPLLRPPGFTGAASNAPTPQTTRPVNRIEDPGDLEVPQGRPTPVSTPGVVSYLVWFVVLTLAVVLFAAFRRTRGRQPVAVKRASMALHRFLSARNLPSPRWLDTWVRWLEMSPIEQSFHAVNQGLTWLGKPQPVHATAAERADALRAILPEADQEIRALLAEQHTALFSPAPGNIAIAVQAGRRVRYQALRKRLSLLFSRNKT
jgi:transglutaminase-like putative cysteine protease